MLPTYRPNNQDRFLLKTSATVLQSYSHRPQIDDEFPPKETDNNIADKSTKSNSITANCSFPKCFAEVSTTERTLGFRNSSTAHQSATLYSSHEPIRLTNFHSFSALPSTEEKCYIQSNKSAIRELTETAIVSPDLACLSINSSQETVLESVDSLTTQPANTDVTHGISSSLVDFLKITIESRLKMRTTLVQKISNIIVSLPFHLQLRPAKFQQGIVM